MSTFNQFPKLHFADQVEAMNVLEERFPEWDGVQTPHVNEQMECLVIVTEPIQLDEEENPIPGTWTGFHVDLTLYADGSEFDSYLVAPTPVTPAHSFQ